MGMAITAKPALLINTLSFMNLVNFTISCF
jgi:hypothetical protein